ncbi:hypothetical protein [Sphingomonas sp. R-74633]|uniref:hypothetical protein n=1 Tax=Sphingomonas sp. R-74633 TaxID=2751188 RepID=UPI0015D1F57B|nr:hypothetical protein [Sphingomonas sp. R-74633]
MSPRPLFALQRLRLPQSEAELPESMPHAALCHRFTLRQSDPAPAKAVWKARP